MAQSHKTITIRVQVTSAFYEALKEFVVRRRRQGKPSSISSEMRAAGHNYMIQNDPDLSSYATYEIEDLV